MDSFSGRAVLVTGASGGIGGATVRRLRKEGATVLAAGRDEEALAALAEETGARPLPFALTEEDSLGEWEATSIPTQAIGDQAFGVRIGRPQFDAAVDYLWVRSGHNLINIRMVSGYSQDNDTRLGTYAQGVLDALD